MTELLAYPGELVTSIRQIVVEFGFGAYIVWYICGLLLFISGLAVIFPGKMVFVGNLLRKDWIFLALISIFLFLLRLPNILLPEQNTDESQLLVGAATLISDFRPWAAVDIHSNGPLNFMPLTLIHYFGGSLSYGSVRLFATIFYVIPTCIFLFFIFRELFYSSIAKLFTFPCIAFFCFQNNPDFTGYNGEHVPMLLTSVILFLSVRCLSRHHPPTIILAVIGFLLGCTPYSKLQSVPIFLAIGIFWCVLLMWEKQYKNWIMFLFYSCLPSLLVLGYLFYTGVVEDFYESYIRSNLLYSKYALVGAISPPLHNRLATILEIFSRNIGPLLPLLSWSLILFLSGMLSLFKIKKPAILQKQLVVLFLITIFAAYLAVVIPGNGFDHYLILFLVPFFSFAGYITATYFLSATYKYSLHKLILLLATVGVPFLLTFHSGSPGIAYALTKPSLEPSELARYVKRLTTPGDRVVFWGFETRYYIEAGVIQGTREAHPKTVLLSGHNDYYRQRFISDLKAYKPRHIVDLGVSGNRLYKDRRIVLPGLGSAPLIKDYVDQHYFLVNQVYDAKIYRRIYQ